MSAAVQSQPIPRLDPATAVGPVVLVARDSAALAAWYRAALGLVELTRSGDAILLGAADGTPILALAGDPSAARPGRREPGLYHTAILLPSRADLGAFLRHTGANGIRLQGAADHLVSEAVYLTDPEGNGVEVYRDRPRADWPLRDGAIEMANAPLDVAGILAAGDATGRPWAGAPAGTVVGHVHLKVADLAAARRFYVDLIGFDATEEGFPSALFISAGGYHHHLGLNTWESAGARRTPGASGLKAVVLTVPAEGLPAVADRLAGAGVATTALADGGLAVTDPSGNRLALVPAAAGAATALALATA